MRLAVHRLRMDGACRCRTVGIRWDIWKTIGGNTEFGIVVEHIVSGLRPDNAVLADTDILLKLLDIPRGQRTVDAILLQTWVYREGKRPLQANYCLPPGTVMTVPPLTEHNGSRFTRSTAERREEPSSPAEANRVFQNWP